MRTLMALIMLGSFAALAADKCESDCESTSKQFEKRCTEIMKKKNASSGGLTMCKEQTKNIEQECKKGCNHGGKK